MVPLSLDGTFTVSQLKTLIEAKVGAATDGILETRWSKTIPKKIGILIWRERIGILPTCENLHKIGIDLDSILCPRCSSDVESGDHALYACEEVKQAWATVAHWWNIELRNVNDLHGLLDMASGDGNRIYTPRLWE